MPFFVATRGDEAIVILSVKIHFIHASSLNLGHPLFLSPNFCPACGIRSGNDENTYPCIVKNKVATDTFSGAW